MVPIKSLYIHCQGISPRHLELYSYILLLPYSVVMQNPKEIILKGYSGITTLKSFLNLPKFQDSFDWNHCWIFQREFPNKRRERHLGCPWITSEQDIELLLQTRIWYLRKEWVKCISFYLRSKHSEQRKCSGSVQGKDPSCLLLRIKSDGPFPVWGERVLLTPQKGLVFCGKKPGTRPQPQRPTLLNNWFYSEHVRTAFFSPSAIQQNEYSSCRRARPDDFLSAVPVSIVLTLLCISAPELSLHCASTAISAAVW